MLANISAAQWLEALPGLCYIVDPSGILLAFGNGLAWHSFATSNGDAKLADWRKLLGRNLLDFITDEVRDQHRDLLASVIQHPRTVQIAYRCDSPDERRDHILLLCPVGRQVILFQNITLTVTHRPRMGLFDVPGNLNGPLVAICSYCKAVRVDRDWITPEAYYVGGGASEVVVTHGVCPACLQIMIAQMRGTETR